MKARATALYLSGHVCGESIVKAAAEEGHLPADHVRLATGFGQGMLSGCVCGALAGAQIVLGARFGRLTTDEDPLPCGTRAMELVERFKAEYKVTCCRALSGKLDRNAPERVQKCAGIVGHVAGILEDMLPPVTPSAG